MKKDVDGMSKKKIRKNFEKKRLLFLRLFSLVLVEMWKYRLFLRDYNVLRQYKVPLHASDYPIVAPPKIKVLFFKRSLWFYIIKMASATFFSTLNNGPPYFSCTRPHFCKVITDYFSCFVHIGE